MCQILQHFSQLHYQNSDKRYKFDFVFNWNIFLKQTVVHWTRDAKSQAGSFG